MPRLASSKILDQIAANLLAGDTTAGEHVYTSRFYPLAEDVLPAIRVYAEDEVVEAQGINLPIRQRHELLVAVDGYVRAVENADDDMHELAYGALEALFGTDDLATLDPLDSVAMNLIGISRGVGEGDEAAMARITVRLSCRYWTKSDQPENLAG